MVIEAVESAGVCAFCGCPVRRGQALCRKHWMVLDHWHRVQIGNAMKEEKESEEGPDEEGRYTGEEYREAVKEAVKSLKLKAKTRAKDKAKAKGEKSSG